MPRLSSKPRTWSRARLKLFGASVLATGTLLSALAATNASAEPTSHSAPTAILPLAVPGVWSSPWSFNPYNSNEVGFANDFVYLNLALDNSPSLTSFTPQLASSWSTTSSTVTINLRSDAKWQNGQPVTSTDLVDTVLLDGTDGAQIWNDISNVAANGQNSVVFTLAPGVPSPNALFDILTGTPVYPASVYGQFVTSDLKADDIAYYTENDKNPTAAAKLPAYKAIQDVYNKVSAYNPPTALGDGPFKLDSITTSEARFSTWSGFYDYSKLHIGGVTLFSGANNQAVYPVMLSGQAAWSNVFEPQNIVEEWLKNPANKIARPISHAFLMEINDRQYPLNITAVRQALAYIIPRNDLVDAAYGDVQPGGAVEPRPDGLIPTMDSQYLSASQLESLNTYPTNDDKAESMLESLGFKKSNGLWYTPKGQVFTINMVTKASDSDITASFEAASAALEAFGINAPVDATTGTVLGEDSADGDFGMAYNSVNSANPLNDIDQALGTQNNFTTLGAEAGEPGLGFGPLENVPGLGKVDVPTTIDKDLATTPPGKQMDQLVWDWTRLVNQQVPYLSYANKVYQFTYSTAHFKDWPPENSAETGPLWAIMSNDMYGGLVVAMEDGYIRPNS